MMITPFVYAIISAEVLSILLSFILLYGNLFETNQKTDRCNIFTVLVATNILALASDAMAWILDGTTEYQALLRISNTIATVLSFVLIGQFIIYMYAYIMERVKINKLPFKIILCLNAASIIGTIVLCFYDKIYVCENGSYIPGALYEAYTMTNVFYLVICAALVAVYYKYLGQHERLAFAIYVAIPAVCALMGVFIEGWSFAYPASTLSLLFIYVVLQAEHKTRLEKETQVSQYYALHDEMTGLNSRRAYVQKLNMLSTTDKNVGVIFTDLNGLKYTNDHFGHEAGDKLIKRFAKMMNDVFDIDDIYRLSGDEFLIMAGDITNEEFEKRVHTLQKLIQEEVTPIACLGYEYGSGRQVNLMIHNAESKMYAEKKEFHTKYPAMKRGE